MANQELTDYDVFLFRQFCADELRKHLAPMRDFWAHAASYKEAGAGEHALQDSSHVRSCGYVVQKRRRRGSLLGCVAAYPFVRTLAMNVLPSDGCAKHILRKSLADPLKIEELHFVLDGDRRIACLSEDAYNGALLGTACEACVVLGREEAYAILAGATLERTRRKLIRAFDMEEGEWLGNGAF